jgi:hypothetical protein
MKRKLIGIVAALAIATGLSHAGMDMYTGKTYKTLLKPTTVGVTMTGALTNMVTLDGAETNAMKVTTGSASGVVTSSVPTGIDCVGLQGVGALALSLNPGISAGGIVSVSVSTCATTNGTYVTLTNAQGSSAWAATGTAAYVIAPVVPNAFGRYWRVTTTYSGATNATVGAVLITE